MSLYDSIKLVINIILVMIIIVFVIWFLKQIRVSKLNKRINSYTITSDDSRHSLADVLYNFAVNTRKRLSKELLMYVGKQIVS